MIHESINKSQLAERFSNRLGIDPKISENIVKIILDEMCESLIKHERIEIRGFGSFEVRYRAPRVARNPRTGKSVQTSEKYSVHFKPGKEMRERINKAASSR
ncbi:MAG: integration host factor subunit beta [Gammaproteobacteria bacterium]|nr:integration host factor subunit beta [Gammaproteobacteria bacterium]